MRISYADAYRAQKLLRYLAILFRKIEMILPVFPPMTSMYTVQWMSEWQMLVLPTIRLRGGQWRSHRRFRLGQTVKWDQRKTPPSAYDCWRLHVFNQELRIIYKPVCTDKLDTQNNTKLINDKCLSLTLWVSLVTCAVGPKYNYWPDFTDSYIY